MEAGRFPCVKIGKGEVPEEKNQDEIPEKSWEGKRNPATETLPTTTYDRLEDAHRKIRQWKALLCK
jgi:hypothetical protein